MKSFVQLLQLLGHGARKDGTSRDMSSCQTPTPRKAISGLLEHDGGRSSLILSVPAKKAVAAIVLKARKRAELEKLIRQRRTAQGLNDGHRLRFAADGFGLREGSGLPQPTAETWLFEVEN